jgi:hypothetical protein
LIDDLNNAGFAWFFPNGAIMSALNLHGVKMYTT